MNECYENTIIQTQCQCGQTLCDGGNSCINASCLNVCVPDDINVQPSKCACKNKSDVTTVVYTNYICKVFTYYDECPIYYSNSTCLCEGVVCEYGSFCFASNAGENRYCLRVCDKMNTVLTEKCFCSYLVCDIGKVCFNDEGGNAIAPRSICMISFASGQTASTSIGFANTKQNPGLCFKLNTIEDELGCVCVEGGIGPCYNKQANSYCSYGQTYAGGVCQDTTYDIVYYNIFYAQTAGNTSGKCTSKNYVIWAGNACIYYPNIGSSKQYLPRCAYGYTSLSDCVCSGGSVPVYFKIKKGDVCVQGGKIQCPSGQYFDDSVLGAQACKSCPENCATCNSAAESCTLCSPGYYLEYAYCKACPANCEYCTSNNQCLSCAYGYGWQNNACVKCIPPSFVEYNICTSCNHHCATCISSTQCTNCQPGYVLGGGKCFLCNDPSDCEACEPKYFYDGQKCQDCAEHCDICRQINNCISCEKTYKLSNGKCSRDNSTAILIGSICSVVVIISMLCIITFTCSSKKKKEALGKTSKISTDMFLTNQEPDKLAFYKSLINYQSDPVLYQDTINLQFTRPKSVKYYTRLYPVIQLYTPTPIRPPSGKQQQASKKVRKVKRIVKQTQSLQFNE